MMKRDIFVDCDEKRHLCKTTAGVKLQFALIDRVTILLKLVLSVKDLRGFKPFDIAEFAEADLKISQFLSSGT